MALNPQQIAQLKQDLIELNKLYEQLGKQKLSLNVTSASVDDVKLLKSYLEEAKIASLDLETGFGGIAESIKNIVREWKPNFVDPAKEAAKSFKKLKGIAEELSGDIRGINQLNKKQLDNSVTQIKLEQAKLESILRELKATKDTNEVHKAIYQNLTSEYDVTKDLLNQASGRLEKEIKIQKTLGVTGKLFQGISGTLQKIGVQSDEIENINKQMREAAESGSKWKTFTTGIGASLKAAFGTLKDPLIQLGLFVKGLKMLVSYGNEYSKSIYEISKNQAINYNYASLEAQRLMDASVASKDILATQQNFVKATNELNDALGLANMYSSKQLEDYTNLTQKLGLTTDEAAAYASFSAISGKSAEDIVNSVAKQTKGNLSNKKVIQEVAKVSGQLYAQYKGNPENIAKAVVQTQKLGMSLQQAQNISRGLLNFEDSITNELEAELLTGKNLNLEKARYLALQGDSAGAAEEIARQVGGLSEFTKLNVIQQESLAKAAGMGVDEFTDTLRKKQEINKLDQGQAKLYQEEIKKAKEAGDMEKAAALEKAMFGRKEFELSKMELDNAAKAQAGFEKASNAFKSGIAPLMEKVSRYLLKLTDFLNNPTVAAILKVAGFGLGVITAAAGIMGAINVIKGIFGRGKVQKVEVVNMGGGLGGGLGGDGEGIGDAGNLGLGGSKPASFLKKLSKPGTMMKALARQGGATFTKAGSGITTKALGKGLLKGGGKIAGNIAGKVLGGSGIGSVLGTVKDQFDFFSEEKTRGTGFGGWLESLGGSGLSLLESIPKMVGIDTAGFGLGISNMDTDNVANARAIYRKLHPDSSTVIPNKELITDIRTNPQSYTEDIIEDQKDVEIEKLNVGGLVTRGGLAQVDTGEMYLGANSITILKNMLDAMKEQNKHLMGILNKEGHVYLDSTKVGTALTVGTSRIQ
jgi:hypothetical protein